MSQKGTYKLPRTFWAGFVDGRLDLDPFPGTDGYYGTLYTSKREARQRYEDVRMVSVMLCPNQGKG